MRKLLSPLCWFVLFSIFFCSTEEKARADLIRVTSKGTVTIPTGAVFGESGVSVPASVSVTLDTSLGGPTLVILQGSTIPSTTDTAGDDFYGYSKDIVVDSSISFGNETWSLDDALLIQLGGGNTSDLVFNASLESGSISSMWAFFRKASGDFQVGLAVKSTPADVLNFYSPGRFIIEENSTVLSATGFDVVVTSVNLTEMANVSEKASLERQLKKAQRQFRRLKKKGDRRKIAKAKRKLKKIKRKLAQL